MKKRTLSLKKFMVKFWAIITVLLLAMFLFYGIYSMWRHRENILASDKMVAETYGQQLNKDISSMEAYVMNIYSDDVHFHTLWNSNITDMQWVRSTYYLANNLAGKTGHMDYFGGVFFYDGEKDSLRSSYSEYPFAGDEYRLNAALKSCLRPLQNETLFEGAFQYEDETYIFYLRGIKNKQVGFVINLNRYFEPPEGQQVIFFDKEEDLLVNSGSHIIDAENIRQLAKTVDGAAYKHQNGTGFIVAIEEANTKDISLALVRRAQELNLWNNWEFWLLVILIPFIALVGFWMLYRMLESVLLVPVDHLLSRITRLKKDDSPVSRKESGEKRIQEFEAINHRLDELLEELEFLTREKHKKEMDAKDAQLQYYQLQVNPHFFLNCLNILDSLLEDHNVANTKLMIHSLSKHFRFVFQDGQKLVTVQEEIEELQSYCNIYTIKGGIPILFQVSAEDKVLGCRIPILCIQTFLENSVKYGSKQGKILSVKVVIEEIIIEDARYLRMQITDNGEGYPAEKLEALNRPVTEFKYLSKNVGIHNIKYRIFLMYGEEAKLCFYNSPSGGAVTEILLPEEPQDEYSGN